MKKILSFLLAIITMAGSFAALPANTAYASTEASVNGIFKADLQLQSDTSRQVTLVMQGGSPLGPSFKGDESGATLHRLTYPISVVKDGGEGTAGYCITPFARGTSPSGEPQTLDSKTYSELDDLDKKLLGIMMAGYPTKTHGKSASDAYMATQIAIQHFVFQHSDKYPNPKKVKFNDDSWERWENTAILATAKAIYEEGINNPYSPENGTVGVEIRASNDGEFEEVGDNLEMTLTIAIDGTFTKGKLTFDSDIKNMIKSNPNCTITVGSRTAAFETGILGSDDYEEGIKVLPGETTAKIVLNKASAESYMDFEFSGDAKNGSYNTSKEAGFTFAVVGGSAKQAYYGKNRNTKNQDYVFFAPGETQPIQQMLFMATSDIWEFDEEPGSGGLKIAKYNKKTNALVAGAIFEIRGVSISNRDFLVQMQASPGATQPLPNGGTAITGIGTIELQNIPAGEYQITELSPPPNFDYCDFGINSQVVTVTAGVESGFYPQVVFENNPYASLKIKKIDAVTGNPVNGAVLRIRNAIANLDVELTTMNGGIIEMKNLPEGNYEISEVYAPEGYVLSDEKKTATLRWGETTDITFENTPKTELLVKKIDGDTGATLDGAVFRLTKPDTGDTWEDVTFYDGYATFLDIPAGTYVLEETKAPQGYILDSTKRTIVVQNYKTNEVIIQNFKKPTLIILKVDEDTAEPLPNAEFRVAKMSGQVIYEGLTGADGTIKLDGLSSEWYKITEIAAPHGYLIATETKDVFFEPNQVLEVKFDNRRRPTLEILKVDEQTNEPLAGAVFHVRKTEDSTVSEYITDASGKITIPNLDEDIYSVVEVKSPDGYLLEPQHKDIQLEWGKVKQLVFTNKARPALEIKKIDAVTEQPLAGAKFKVTKTEDLTVSEYVTDENGIILIKNLDDAIYTVEEVTAPDGYILNTQHKEIQLEWGKTKTLIYENTRKPTLIVTKLNGATNQPVPGATYKVEYEAAGGGVVTLGSYLTDANGQIIIPKVNAGWYIVTETKAAPGFSLPSNPVTRIYLNPGENAYLSEGTGTESGSYDGDITVLSGNDFTPTLNAYGELVYDWPLNSVVIKKAHAITGELLEGAAFELYRADEQVSGVPGTNVGRFTTDNSGIIVIPALQPGYYVVKEVQAPQNFLISENSMQNGFLKADGTTVLEFAFANYPYGSILITKVDAQTNAPLANARFRVTDGSGAVLGNTNGEYITDENGEIIIPNVKPDSYVVTEIEAPEHYTIDTSPQTVNVGTDGKTYKVSFKNQPAGEIVIRKMDFVSKQPLADAEFKVTDSTGAVVGTGNGIFKTDATGTVKIPNLPKGSYVLEEIVAPTGYVLENQTQTVAVDYGKTYTIDFYNKKMSGLQIIKIDSVTKQPLKGAEFTVYKQSGEIVDRYVTDADGVIIIETLTPGWYKVVETKTLPGYLLDETPKDVQITANQFVKVVFENAPMSGLIIRKVDADTRDPLSGAEFTVRKADEQLIGIYRSGTDGIASVGLLEPGWYTVTETKSPDGYTLGDNVQTIEITNSKTITIEFQNRAFGSIVIKKIDEISGKPLSGANFEVQKQGGGFVGEYTTGVDGTVNIPSVEPGWYVVHETKSPTGYTLDSTAKTVEVKPVVPSVVTFSNKPLSGIEIIKTDAVTHNPLAGATFVVERSNGERIGSYKTDAAGKIIVPDLTEGTYVVSETIAPDGYHLNETPKTAVVVSGKLTTVEFANKPKSGIEIIKLDAITNAPLSGATFTIERDNGEMIGTFKTDMAGKIIAPDLSEGTYIVSETIAPDGYTRDEVPKTVIVKTGKLTMVEFRNKPLSGIEIVKIDAITKAPLMGATFVVERPNGEKVGTFKTDAAGKIIVPDLTEGTYVVSETIAPDGYMLTETPKTVVVTSGKLTSVEFTNKPHSGIQIIKLDTQTKMPLTGATFLVQCDNGERIGEYKTDSTGKIIVSDLTEGTYIISETNPPDGYILDEAPKTVIVKSGKLTTVEFFNKALSGLKIIKLNSATRNPIEGVEFTVTKMSSESVNNAFNGTTFKTDKTGQIYIPQLENGYYVVTETSSADGYILDGEPKTVLVESGKPTVLEVLNTPMSGLLIVKTDEATGRPLAGVVFDVRRADGQFVAGSILDGNQPNTEATSPNKTTSPNGDITGSYTTDKNGRILINGLSAGEYHVVERKAQDGYELDDTVHAATVTPGKLTTLQITNKQKAGLRLVKVDSITKKPIYNVEFMLFDANDKVVGTYYTDNNGVIDFSNIITEGRYTIRETRAADGYYLDEIPKTVEFVSGKVTEIVWTNVPKMAQIQILKKSGDDNEVNALPAGTPLAGAVFEAYDYKTGNLVDRFVSGSDGRAVSAPLPLGRYIIKEVKAPQWYKLSDKTLDVDLEFATQIVKLEYLNYAANTGVTIRKTGPAECMPGDTISYTIREVQNTGTTPLTDFYWRDTLPVDAVRLTKIVTGSYNQSLKYKIIATTNKGDTRVIADNLSTTKNNVIDCSNASLGLKNDEFVTSFTLVFGTVKAGFAQVEQPQVFVKVLSTLQNQYQFANKVDVAGKYGSEWVAGNASTLCTVYKKQSPLPRTGY